MTTSIGISTAALAVATNADNIARDAACKETIAHYDNTTATVEQMQTYADCVDRLHPDNLSPETILMLKGIALLFLVLTIGGGIKTWITDGDLWGVLLGFLAACGIALAVLLISFIVWG